MCFSILSNLLYPMIHIFSNLSIHTNYWFKLLKALTPWYLLTIKDHFVEHLKHMFLIFKQYYTYFYTLFHLQIFQKNTNNITQILLSNRPKSSNPFIFMFSFTKFTLHYVTIKPEFWKEAFSKISHFDFYVLSCKDNAFMYVLHIIELGAFWHVINFDWKISLLKCQYVAILL